MIKTRRLALDVRYNSYPFAGQVGGDIESLTYTDSAADNSDSINITINAQDRKWLLGWMPEKGATLRARILGYNWERQGQRSIMECGLFVLDDVSFSDAPTTLQVGGVSKPSDSDFSELERDVIWKNTSIKRIGAKIAARYGLAFTYDADDYDIECDEQDGTDSSYYNGLCKKYGLILKVYARRLWVYDREKYKAKRAVRTFDRSQIRPGSFGYTTTLSGTYTGGYFNYTDADKDIDIECSVGGGSHTKSVNRRATSVYDASVQLCAELNSANHGTVKLRFGVDGDWRVSAGNCIALTGFGNLNGKYFVDKVTHKVTNSGLTTDFECSGIGPAFHSWDVGGKIVLPGFVDAHIHLESSLVSPTEFAKAVLPHGTTTVITDPHEIANVMGTDGIEYMLQATEDLPVDVRFMLPSCVPATPLDESGANLDYRAIDSFYDHPRVQGLAEMMNYVGVVNGDGQVVEKIVASQAHHKKIDGHAPGLSGKDLNAYIAAGVYSDHECSDMEDAMNKLRLGQYIMIREGTAARNLEALMPLLHS